MNILAAFESNPEHGSRKQSKMALPEIPYLIFYFADLFAILLPWGEALESIYLFYK